MSVHCRRGRGQNLKAEMITARINAGRRNAGSPTWARTRDLRINSPALYRLSYRGTEERIIGVECPGVKRFVTFQEEKYSYGSQFSLRKNPHR